MLVLSRRLGEEIVIGDGIRVKIVAINNRRVRLGITAPSDVIVNRDEVQQRRQEFLDDSPCEKGVHTPWGLTSELVPAFA